MKIVKEKDVKVDDVVEVLKNEGLVVYPTETLYGIGADATNPNAIKKLTKYKKRPVGKPYSIAVSNILMAKKYTHINTTAKNIYDVFLPGPVTVVSKGKHKVAKGVESETGSLGIRIPDYELIREIIKAFGKPITATSANASYKKRPYKISDILDNISNKQKLLIDLIIDAGELPKNDPSTVVDTTSEDLPVLRQGDVSLKSNNEVLSSAPESTENFAKELWQKYENYAGLRAIIFALSGDMGVGKTIFTKGLAKAMGIDETVTSPTYNLTNSYLSNTTGKKLVHIDAWRIFDVKELDDLNFSKEISDKSILSVEWSEKIIGEIRKHSEDAIIVWVKIYFGKKVNDRNISWKVADEII